MNDVFAGLHNRLDERSLPNACESQNIIMLANGAVLTS